MPERDVEQLLVSLILDNRVNGHIDQVNRLLERGDRYPSNSTPPPPVPPSTSSGAAAVDLFFAGQRG